jgi:hypothetical protein
MSVYTFSMKDLNLRFSQESYYPIFSRCQDLEKFSCFVQLRWGAHFQAPQDFKTSTKFAWKKVPLGVGQIHIIHIKSFGIGAVLILRSFAISLAGNSPLLEVREILVLQF